jgi:3-oxoacyl-[acyl-carrier protein] reductase
MPASIEKVIVTGASKGIGRGIATVLGKSGFEVGLLARSEDLLREVEAEIVAAGGRAAVAPCDLRDAVATQDAIERLIGEMEGAGALINNAGLVIRKDIFSLSLEEWRSLLETNVSGIFHATRAVLPHLKGRGGGHIVNVSSISGRLPLAGGSAYAATKYAVTGFSESLFLEVRNHGIKVTTIFPGSVATRSHREEPREEELWKLRPEEVGEACRDLLRTAPGNCISRLEIRPVRPPPR